jgi:glutamate-1-semialdehyde 2,1-aminomutase
MLPFEYNRLDQLDAIVRDHGATLAAIVMEPVRRQEPADGFLSSVRATASRVGAALIFDEITSGWRLASGGAHLRYGVAPDIAVFAKAMGNGFPIAAVIGIAGLMEAAQTTFISSTSWSERVGPAAALATIRKHRHQSVPDHLIGIGSLVQQGWRSLARRHGLPVHVAGIPPLGHLSFAVEHPDAVRTLFTQLMLERGFLAAGGFYAMYAHQPEQVERYLAAADEVFGLIATAVADGTVASALVGPVAHTGFRRLE